MIRDVPDLSLRQVAARSRELIARGPDRALRSEEMQGGTFTITNLGSFGIDVFTPIINAPQCAVLGMGRIVRQVVALDPQFVVRERMTLSLTFDHRIVDGSPGGAIPADARGPARKPERLAHALIHRPFETRGATMRSDLSGKVSLVTGAARGIGQAIADRLAC